MQASSLVGGSGLKISVPPQIQALGGLSRPQQLIVRSAVPFTFFSGGFGSGKTLAAALKALVLSAVHCNAQGMVVEPTYRMLEDIFLPTFRSDVLEPLGLLSHFRWRAKDYLYECPWGGRILFRSADKPSVLRGHNLAWFLIDEATMIRRFRDVWTSLFSRLRHPGTRIGPRGVPMYCGACFGTPEGVFDDVYDIFLRPPDGEKERDFWSVNYATVFSSSYDNPGLSDLYKQTLESQIIEEMRPAHIGGRWISLGGGKAYWALDETRNVRPVCFDERYSLRFSFDFNVAPMSCVVWQVHSPTPSRESTIMIIDEITITRGNTPMVCKLICSRYKSGLPVYVYGDSTGASGTAEFTDYETILNHLNPHFPAGVEMRVKNANPLHKSRLHSVNRKLSDGTLLINKKCTRLLRDLRNQRTVDTGQKDKDQAIDGQSLGHHSDCLDYLVDFHWPYLLDARADLRQKVVKSPLHNW